MFKEAKLQGKDSVTEADICVIGTGAAGISFALEFVDSSFQIVMLESGPLEDTPSADDPLYDVETVGLKITNQSRKRGFGGTTTRWSGKWKRPDLIDFKQRLWVPLSGWPLTREKLDPYYERASFSLHAPNIVKDFLMPKLFEGTDFESTPFLMQPPHSSNWSKVFAETFKQSKNISVHFGAHVTQLDIEGGVVRKATVRSESGTYVVKARHYILACGGIENARLLLISNIGNEHDQVGRYFMDHPKGHSGIIDGYRPIDLKDYWHQQGHKRYIIGFRLSDEVQKKEQILNSHILIESGYPQPMTIRNKIARKIFKRTASPFMEVRSYLEQVPVATNRLILSAQHDAYGLPKARLEWNLSDADKKTVVVLHRYLKTALEQANIGSLHSPLLETPNAPFPITRDAYHHMGTTRMGIDPATSVVDPNCKVHTADNLFIAGSSVFPTSGHTNPMATISALAIRLADHCKTL